jgi:16S rRNA (adenine1518-N6/adenine1519-N6)-dimethyltransferase
VRSAVLRLTFREPAHRVPDEALLEGMVRAMFTQRRKTLANALAPFASTRGMAAATALRAAGIDPVRRAETLGPSEVAALATVLASQVPARRT